MGGEDEDAKGKAPQERGEPPQQSGEEVASTGGGGEGEGAAQPKEAESNDFGGGDLAATGGTEGAGDADGPIGKGKGKAGKMPMLPEVAAALMEAKAAGKGKKETMLATMLAMLAAKGKAKGLPPDVVEIMTQAKAAGKSKGELMEVLKGAGKGKTANRITFNSPESRAAIDAGKAAGKTGFQLMQCGIAAEAEKPGPSGEVAKRCMKAIEDGKSEKEVMQILVEGSKHTPTGLQMAMEDEKHAISDLHQLMEMQDRDPDEPGGGGGGGDESFVV